MTQALVDLPNNFGSVIVGALLGSIFIPMLLSSVHLMNSGGVAKQILKSSSTLKRFLKTGLFYLMSPFHPIFLDKLQYETAEKARILAENYNIQATDLMEQCRTFKSQLVTFIKIELGIKFKSILLFFVYLL